MTQVAISEWPVSEVRTGDAVVVHTVVLLGNPNVGKTTLFNALTGENARVGNYPGITVEKRSATLELGEGRGAVELVDVPGCYSLSARSAEEQVALLAALGLDQNPKPSLAVVVIDAGQLVRNLYLALQLCEFQIPFVIALTMLDEVDQPPSPEAVGALFGVRAVAVSGKYRTGLDALREAVTEELAVPRTGEAKVEYPTVLRADVDRIAGALPTAWRRNVEHDRAMALWALLSLDDTDELDAPAALRGVCETVRDAARDAARDTDLEVIAARYAFIEQGLAEQVNLSAAEADVGSSGASSVTTQTARQDWTERLDRVLLHPVWGFLLFLGVMLTVFQALFSWTDPAIGLIEDGVVALQEWAMETLPAGLLTDLLTEGVIGGVGNVVVFLPQIALLFFLIGLLEDSGYMARVAYLMDRVLRGVGLHGRAFVPMLSGLACAVPAILATRTMERQRDRLLTMLVIPLMTCSARLPVYTLIVGALFPPSRVFGLVPVQGLLMVSMYVFATLLSLIAAHVLGRTLVRGRSVPLLLELPRYRWPSVGTTLRMTWQRAREFLVRAGSVILAFTIILWMLLSFPKEGQLPREQVSSATSEVPTLEHAPPSEAEPASITESYAGRLGKALEPAMAPLGFDWKITVGIIGAFSAREVFISTMGMVFGLGSDDDVAEPLRDRMRAETRPDGKPAYPPLVGLSLMVFFALACQCMSTIAVVKRETQTWRWPIVMFVYMTTLAYVCALIVYQGGRLLGFEG